MTSIKSWSDVLGGAEVEQGGQRQMTMNLKKVVEDEINDHEKYVKSYESRNRFNVEYKDIKITFEQKGWTIYHWVLYDRSKKGEAGKINHGLTFGSEGVLDTIKMLRANRDGVVYERPKPKTQEIDPAQLVYEMEQFRINLQGALAGHPLFVASHVSHVFIFVIYQDIMFSVKPDNFGNFEYELLERRGELEAKLCKVGKTIGQGGIVDRIKELRSAWDITHDPGLQEEE